MESIILKFTSVPVDKLGSEIKFDMNSAQRRYYHEIQIVHSIVNILLQNAIEAIAAYANKVPIMY